MRHLFLVVGVALCLLIGARIAPAQEIDRPQLPIPEKQYKYPGKVPLDARDAKFPPIKPLRPPEGAPNVIVNGEKIAECRIENTVPFVFSADETEDVGEDLATPVTEDYKEGDNKFTGTVDKVTIAITPPPSEMLKEEEGQDTAIDEGMN